VLFRSWNEFIRKYKGISTGSPETYNKLKIRLIEIGNAFGGVKKVNFIDNQDKTYLKTKEYDCIDLCARKNRSRETIEIHQRLLCDLKDLSKPALLFEIQFSSNELGIDYEKPSWYGVKGDFITIYHLTLNESTLAALESSRSKDKFEPFGLIPNGNRIGYSRSGFIKSALKFKDKFIEWAAIARERKVERFEKLFPGELEGGFKFVWNGQDPYITSDGWVMRGYEEEYLYDETNFIKLGPPEMEIFTQMIKIAPVYGGKIQGIKPTNSPTDELFN
jgi:hypothetical protein